MYTDLKSKPLSGIPTFGLIPDGWGIRVLVNAVPG